MTETIHSIDDYTAASKEVWNVFRNHFDGDNSDEYWNEVMDQMFEIGRKYQETGLYPYVKQYIILCVEVLNERAKARNKAF